MTDTRTYGQMISRITREIRRDGLTADIKDAIAGAVDMVKDERFWFKEGESTADMTVGVDIYDLPTDYQELDAFHLEDTAGQKYDLRQVGYSEMDLIDTQSNGHPDTFCIYRDQLYIRPPTNRPFSMRMSYLKDIELSASASDGTTNAWTTHGERLIRCMAKSELFEHRLRNTKSAAIQRALAEDELARLRRRSTKHMADNRVKKTKF